MAAAARQLSKIGGGAYDRRRGRCHEIKCALQQSLLLVEMKSSLGDSVPEQSLPIEIESPRLR